MDVVRRMNELKANYAQTTGALCEEPVSFFQFGWASASHATCRPHSFKNPASDVDEWDEKPTGWTLVNGPPASRES